MKDPWRFFDRRDFLRRSAYLIPLLHPGVLQAAPLVASETAQRPVEFQEVELRSHRIEEQQRFYRDVLGLETSLEGSGLVVHAGTTRLRFLPAKSGEAPMYHFAFMISENKLEKAIEWMKGKAPLNPHPRGGVVFHFRRWNAHSIYFFDPAGNLAELIAHHELPTAAEGSFTTKDILFLSEVGLVAPTLAPLLTELEQRLGLTPFFSASDNFAPVGNRHGLFICVPQKRIWLATDIPAETHPVRATLKGAAEKEVQLLDLPFTVRTVT